MYIAVFIGIVLGWWLAARHIDHWLIIFYHFRYRSPEKYLQLYDLCDGEFTFQMMKRTEHPPKDYAQFLLWHQEYRPNAGAAFRKYWKAISRELIRDYALFVLLPTLLLWGNWAYFLAPVLLIHIGYLIHRKLIKKNNLDFYAMLMHTLILKDSQKIKV